MVWCSQAAWVCLLCVWLCLQLALVWAAQEGLSSVMSGWGETGPDPVREAQMQWVELLLCCLLGGMPGVREGPAVARGGR